MKRYLTYLFFHLLSLLATAQSARIEKVSSIVEPSFVATYLNHQQIMAFQNRAMQKVEDLEEYLQIAANPIYEQSLRDQAAKMVLDLFVADAQITFEDNDENKVSSEPIGQFLQSLLKRDTESPLSIVQNKHLLLPFGLSEHAYEGQISYELREQESIVSKRFVVIHLQRVQKFFGKTMEEVWEVKLGDIRSK